MLYDANFPGNQKIIADLKAVPGVAAPLRLGQPLSYRTHLLRNKTQRSTWRGVLGDLRGRLPESD